MVIEVFKVLLLLLLFTYSFHSHEYCCLVVIMNCLNTETFCKTSSVFNNVIMNHEMVRLFNNLVGIGKELFHRLTQTEAQVELIKAQNFLS